MLNTYKSASIEFLKEGLVVFHKRGIRGEIKDISKDEQIMHIRFEKTFGSPNNPKRMNFDQIGKTLFFKEDDMKISEDDIWQQYPYNLFVVNDTSDQKENFVKKKQAIHNILDSHNIKKLIHFSHIHNIPSILENGLVPIIKHEELQIKSVRSDEMRLDGQPDCTSFSLSFPNCHMFWSKHRHNKDQWAIVEVSPQIIATDNRICFFCPKNAASLGYTLNYNFEYYTSPDALKEMFCQSAERKIMSYNRSVAQTPDCYTTDPQAEVLIEGIINKEFIIGISVYSEEAKKMLLSDISVNNVPLGLEISTNPAFYQDREDIIRLKGENRNGEEIVFQNIESLPFDL